jgi:hypothetical protein
MPTYTVPNGTLPSTISTELITDFKFNYIQMESEMITIEDAVHEQTRL